MDVSENLRKLIMAGIGAVSIAAEKSQDALDVLAKKGEDAVNQGKVLNEQLRHEVKKAVSHAEEPEPAEENVKDSILSALDTLNAEERAEVLGKLSRLAEGEAKDGE